MRMTESGSASGLLVEEARLPVGQEPPANVRAIMRVGADFFLRSIDTMARVMNDDLILALVYSAMWTANVKHITNSAANIEYGALEKLPPDSARVPVSAMALANSLRMPYETVRRYVQTLLKAGFCVRLGNKGYVVPNAVLVRPSQHEAILRGLPSLLQFLGDLKRAEFNYEPYHRVLPNTAPLPSDGAVPSNIRSLLRAGTELILRGIDTLGRLRDDDFLTGLLFTAIWTANVQHITASQDNLKFGGLRELPPDDLRRPVTVHALAASLRIPYETLRRTANRLVRDGIAVRIGNKGLIVPRQQHANLDSYDTVRRSYANIVRAVADLHRAGFDFSSY
jgi:DNA-binding transcriptional regulator YhcF (GntR family)